jgi:hypothetical protein
MSSVNKSGTFNLGNRTVNRLGYGAMQLAGPDFYGPHVTNQIIREALAPIAMISSSSPRSAPGAARMDHGSRPSRAKN